MREEIEGTDGESYECYEFNPRLRPQFDDGTCEHCRKWLTVECENIDEFVHEEEWEDEY